MKGKSLIDKAGLYYVKPVKKVGIHIIRQSYLRGLFLDYTVPFLGVIMLSKNSRKYAL